MHLAVDIILLSVLVFTVIGGYRKGLIKTAFGFVGIFLALWIASTFSSGLGTALDDAFVHSAVEETITSNLTDAFEDGGADNVAELISEYAPNKEVEQRLIEIYTQRGKESIETISDELTDKVSLSISTAVAFIGLFIIAYIAIKLLSFILDKFFRLPILNTANRWLGLVVGAFTAILLLMVISRSFESILPWLSKSYPHIFHADLSNETVLYGFFCKYNLFSALIVGVIGFIN